MSPKEKRGLLHFLLEGKRVRTAPHLSQCSCWYQRLPDTTVSYFFKISFIYFREKGEGGEKERERNMDVCLVASHTPQPRIWPATQARALTGNQTGNLSVRRPVLSPLSHTSQGDTTVSMVGLLANSKTTGMMKN